MTDVIDGTAEDVTPAAAPDPGTTALARRERRSEVIRPLAADQLVDSFAEYQRLLPQLLDSSDYQGTGDDAFVKKSGWRKIATAFDLDVQLVDEVVERDDAGRILRSKVVARAIAPSGRAMDGDGTCTRDEFTGKRATDPKLESNLRGTAATRAKNRAISDLVGMGAVSAEEVGTAAAAAAGPEYGPAAAGTALVAASAALMQLCGDNGEIAQARWGEIKQAAGGYMPRIAAAALVIAAGQRKEATP